MATHRDYKIAYHSPDKALVRFYEGEYQDIVPEEGGDAVRTYVRTGTPREQLFTFDHDCTYERLVDFLDNELNSEGAKTSIPEQVRKRAPALSVRSR
jgi:hypothetical protein